MNQPQGFTLFWGSRSPLSQWHPAPFRAPAPGDGPNAAMVEFAHAEQYMMAAKATHFGDRRSYEQIMATTDPRRAKELGRAVTPFDAAEWNRVARGYVRAGNLQKFTQNPALRLALLATGDTMLVEASPYDRVWGIGLAASHPDATNPSRWRGTNWLGEVLTDVRAELRGKP